MSPVSALLSWRDFLENDLPYHLFREHGSYECTRLLVFGWLVHRGREGGGLGGLGKPKEGTQTQQEDALLVPRRPSSLLWLELPAEQQQVIWQAGPCFVLRFALCFSFWFVTLPCRSMG